MTVEYLWRFLVIGYFVTIAIELPILVIALTKRHPLKHRLFAGFWLTACTYPIVVLVLPTLFELDLHPERRTPYLIVAEIFAPAAECLLFWLAFGRAEPRSRSATIQDLSVVTVANLASFGFGLLLEEINGWQLMGL